MRTCSPTAPMLHYSKATPANQFHRKEPSRMTNKLWGGRFTGKTDPLMEKFNASINFDKRLWAVDIQGSQAYARALARAGMLSEAEAEQLVTGLAQVGSEWQAGNFVLQPG